jgi:hypothetical protein
MNKIKLYHSCKLETLNSISKHGLIKSPLDNLIYFCDNDDSSIKWIEWREELRNGIKLKELGIVIFETTNDDPYLSRSTDHNPILLNMLDIQGSPYCYSKSIHPSKLTFQKVRIHEEYFEYFDINMKEKFITPSERIKKELYKKSMDNIIVYSPTGGNQFLNKIKKELFKTDIGGYYSNKEKPMGSRLKSPITQSENL